MIILIRKNGHIFFWDHLKEMKAEDVSILWGEGQKRGLRIHYWGRQEENRSLEYVLLGVWQEVHYQGLECPVAKGLECGFELEPVVANSYSQVQQQKKDSPLSGQHWSWQDGSWRTKGEGIRVQARPSLQEHHNLCVYMYRFPCLDLTFPGQLLVILQASCHMLPHPEPPLSLQLIKPLSDWGTFFSAPTTPYVVPSQLVSAALQVFI